jgi:N-acetylglucosamine kinase-like BadF-type ATPase
VSYLGLDVGGTSCRFACWPENAQPGGSAPGVQPVVHGVDATVAALAAVLATACRAARPAAAVLALAGAGDPAIRQAIVAGLRARGVEFPVAVVGDVLAAAAAGLREGPGVLVWSGTGSFAVARGADGRLHRVGGRGFLLGDQGSGYDLVRRAAAAALLAADGLGPATALTAALAAAFAAPTPQRLGAVLQQLAPGQVAGKLGVVVDAAAAGDAVANEVLAAGVDALAMLAAGAVRAAGLDWRGLDAAIGGGVLTSAPAVAASLVERLRALGAANVRTIAPDAAARGAAWLAHGWHRGESPAREWVEHGAL